MQALWVSNAPREAAAEEALETLHGLSGEDRGADAAAQASGPARVALTALGLSRVVPREAGMPLFAPTFASARPM